MKDIMATVKSLKGSGLLIKGVSEATKNKAKENISGYVVRCIRCQFIRKYVSRKKVVRGGDGVIRVGIK